MQLDCMAAPPRGDRLMWLTTHRVFYAGLLGPVGERTLGGWAAYVSLSSNDPIRVCIGNGAWQSGELLVVPPQVPHRVESVQPLVLNLVIESDSRFHVRPTVSAVRRDVSPACACACGA